MQFSVLNRLFEVTDEKWRMEIDSLLFVLMQFILRETEMNWTQMKLIYLHHILAGIEN